MESVRRSVMAAHRQTDRPRGTADLTPPRYPRVGLYLPTMSGGIDGRTPRWRDYVELAGLAEAAGFDSVWVPDELLWWEPTGRTVGWWHGWTIATAIAAVTHRVEIGTLVTCSNYVSPAVLAKMAETLDEVSGGRFTLGLGVGWSERQFRAFGFATDHLIGRFAESVAIIHDLLRTGRSSYQGRFHSAVDAELLPNGRRARLPILIGGTGPRVMRLAARYADGWNAFLVGRGSADQLPPLRARLDEACVAVGRDPASLERSAAVIASPEGRPFLLGGADWTERALRGTDEEIARQLIAFANEGIDQLQVGILPTTRIAVERFGRILEHLDTLGLGKADE